jgi:hypothetical protein
MSFETPSGIRERSNYNELQLGNSFMDENWLQAHLNKKVEVSGFLFHAHTGHHYTPILIDLQKISDAQ